MNEVSKATQINNDTQTKYRDAMKLQNLVGSTKLLHKVFGLIDSFRSIL